MASPVSGTAAVINSHITVENTNVVINLRAAGERINLCCLAETPSCELFIHCHRVLCAGYVINENQTNSIDRSRWGRMATVLSMSMRLTWQWMPPYNACNIGRGYYAGSCHFALIEHACLGYEVSRISACVWQISHWMQTVSFGGQEINDTTCL